jgi:hypothetical protein
MEAERAAAAHKRILYDLAAANFLLLQFVCALLFELLATTKKVIIKIKRTRFLVRKNL